jgi:hypothetical protein
VNTAGGELSSMHGNLVGPLSLAGWGRLGCKTCPQGSGVE